MGKGEIQRNRVDLALNEIRVGEDDTVDTVPTTGLESDTDYYLSDEETIVASNCSRQSSATGGVGEGVLKSQSRVTHIPGLSSLASSATPSGHNIS